MKTRNEYIYELQAKFKTLNSRLWENRVEWTLVEQWLAQFDVSADPASDEQLQMLFLASHFMYFGERELRALLKSLYRDLYQYRIVEGIRQSKDDTLDRAIIQREFDTALSRTQFIGMGHPSESGALLLYPFRQENGLTVAHFGDTKDVLSRHGWKGFWRQKLTRPEIKHYVFIDDLCGSGTQAEAYSRTLDHIKRLAPDARLYYFPLIASAAGLQQVRQLNRFDEVAAVIELDESFKCFADASRIYKNETAPFDKDLARQIAMKYGRRLWPANPLGWKDGQLLLGFQHNTPDNTLPVMWFAEGAGWVPLFKRHHKK